MGADGRAGMNIDAGSAVRPLGHHAGNDRHLGLIKPVRQPLNGDGLDAGIRKDDLLTTECGWVPLISSLDVGMQEFTNFGQVFAKFEQDRLGPSGGPMGIANADAFTHLDCEPFHNRRHPFFGQIENRVLVDGIVIVKTGKENPQQIFANRADRPFRRHVMNVLIVEASQLIVRGYNVRNDLFPSFIHG